MNNLISSSTIEADIFEKLRRWSVIAQGAYAPNSERAWRSDLSIFINWCAHHGLCAIPARPEAVAAFLRAEAESGRAVATVRRRAATIALAHRAAGSPNPCDSQDVDLAMRTIARTKGTQQKQAPALVARDADRIVAKIDDAGMRTKDVRDLALLLVGRDLLARGSELIGITREMIEEREGGVMQVMLRRRKTSTEATPCQLGPESSAALRRWLEVSGITSGPVFLSVKRNGQLRNKPMPLQSLSECLRSLAKRAGIRQPLSSHSLRVGMAQDLVAANISTAAIMQAAGWTTEVMVARYTRNLSAERGAIAQYHARRQR